MGTTGTFHEIGFGSCFIDLSNFFMEYNYMIYCPNCGHVKIFTLNILELQLKHKIRFSTFQVCLAHVQ